MKNILFPTDFSDNSKQALNVALDLAKDFNATLHVLNTYKMPYSSSSPMTRTFLEKLEKSSQKELNEWLDEIKLKPEFSSVDIKLKAMAGNVANSIDVYANKLNIDLIVMGTKGASGIKEVLVGSNTEEVVTHSDKPVLVVPINSSIQEVKKIVFAVDLLDPGSPHLYSSFVDFAKKYNSEVYLVYIGSNSNEYEDKVKKQKESLLQLFKDVNVSFYFEESDDVILGINNFVSRHQVDMLAVLSRKHGFIDKIFHKSISKSLTCHVELPMFVVKEI